jgi:hypothetical protein
MADGFYPGGNNYKTELYKAKHEDDYEKNDIEAILDLLYDEYIYSHKRIKLNACAFCKLFFSLARCLEDISCDTCMYFCGFTCCFYNCVNSCIKKQCLWTYCCCFFRCCCKDVNKIPGYKLRRLYKKSVKRIHEDMDLFNLIQNQKALKVVHDN